MERKYVITITTRNRFLVTVELENEIKVKNENNIVRDISSLIFSQDKNVIMTSITALIYTVLIGLGLVFNSQTMTLVAAFISLFSCSDIFKTVVNKFAKDNELLITWVWLITSSFALSALCELILGKELTYSKILTAITAFAFINMISKDIVRNLQNNTTSAIISTICDNIEK